MFNIYFDNVLIDNDSYSFLDNDYKLFEDNTSFRLGATACNTFKLHVDKTEVSNTPTEVRIEDGTTVFHLIVDSLEEDDDIYIYTLVDELMKFNFNYDASVLIEEKKNNNEDCYLSDIWKDMCSEAGVEYDENYTFLNDIIVTWYDNRRQARQYLSYVAELQYGFARIDENGKLTFKKHNSPSVKTINIDDCSDFILGEKKTISRVVYDNGTFKWEYGDDTGSTLYLNPENVYIINETIIENIYNELVGFSFYILEVPECDIDSSVRAGDVITFTDGTNNYPTIAQYSIEYFGGWSGGYKIQVNTEAQQETQITGVNTKVMNLQTSVDRLNNEFSIIAEEIEGLTDFIRNVGTTGTYLRLPDTPKSNGAINTLSIKGFELLTKYKGMQPKSRYGVKGYINFYTLIFDTVATFDSTPNYIYVDSPVPLNKLGSVYDEILIEQNKIKVIQRIGYDVNYNKQVLSNPIIHELNDVLLPTFDGDTFVKVLYFNNLQFDAEYIVKNDLTSNFATQLESSSQFLMNQKQVVLKVNAQGKVVAVELGSNASTGSYFEVVADNISLEGLTTINGNFRVLEDGSIEAVNGKFSGDITIGNTHLVDKKLGLLATFIFPIESMYGTIGWSGFSDDKYQLMGGVIIQDNFEIKSAKLFLKGNKTEMFGSSSSLGMAIAHNVKLKKDPIMHYKIVTDSGVGIIDYSTTNTNALGENGVTVGGVNGTEHFVDVDINYFNKGFNHFIIESDMAKPSTETGKYLTNVMATAFIQITGYYK